VEQAAKASTKGEGDRDGEAPSVVARGLGLVHDVYADVYEAFHARWVAADPPNVLSFPAIFDDLKTATRRRLRLARGDLSLLAFLP